MMTVIEQFLSGHLTILEHQRKGNKQQDSRFKKLSNESLES